MKKVTIDRYVNDEVLQYRRSLSIDESVKTKRRCLSIEKWVRRCCL